MFSCLSGLGAAFAWSPSIAAMAAYFSKRRALANGIAVGGAGVGNLILPPVIRLCLDVFGFKGALLILSGLMLHVCVSAFLLRPPQFYVRNAMELKCMKNSEAEADPSRAKRCADSFFCPRNRSKSTTNIFDWTLLKNPLFILYGLSSFFFFCGFPGLFVIIAPHAQVVGHSKKDAAFLLSIMGIADIVGRVGTGWFADLRLLRRSNIVVISQMITCVATCIIPFVHNFIGIATLCWVNGMFTGSFMAIIPVILAESLGIHRVASSLGLIGIFMGAGVVVSPPTVGEFLQEARVPMMTYGTVPALNAFSVSLFKFYWSSVWRVLCFLCHKQNAGPPCQCQHGCVPPSTK